MLGPILGMDVGAFQRVLPFVERLAILLAEVLERCLERLGCRRAFELFQQAENVFAARRGRHLKFNETPSYYCRRLACLSTTSSNAFARRPMTASAELVYGTSSLRSRGMVRPNAGVLGAAY